MVPAKACVSLVLSQKDYNLVWAGSGKYALTKILIYTFSICKMSISPELSLVK